MGNIDTPLLKGITPRIVESIFKTIFRAPESIEFTVKISFLEIYMEKIRDLLYRIEFNFKTNSFIQLITCILRIHLNVCQPYILK